MPMLTLADVLAIAAPERERLVEVDDAIRDLAPAVEDAAEQDGFDRQPLSRALVGVIDRRRRPSGDDSLSVDVASRA